MSLLVASPDPPSQQAFRLVWLLDRVGAPARSAVGDALLVGAAGFMTLFGTFYMALAMTTTLLPSDAAYLGIGSSQLCSLDDCRLNDFLSHGRMSYGGALVAVGVMTGWLAIGPFQRGEAWAWWTFLLAAVATYCSFFSFFATGSRFDWSLALLAGIGVPLSILGLVLTYHQAVQGTSLAKAFRTPGARTWIHVPRGRARLLIAALGVGIGAAGLSILAIASSVVFVPQDTAFLRANLDDISEVSTRLAPLMSHDRAAYGGSMVATGILFTATALKGMGPGQTGATRAITISGVTFYMSTLLIHLSIGYTSFIHLAPVYGGLVCVLLCVAILTRGSSPSPMGPGTPEPHAQQPASSRP